MAFIGVITSNKNEEVLKKSIENILKNCSEKHSVIILTEENIQNMKNIKFNSRKSKKRVKTNTKKHKISNNKYRHI